MEKNSTVINVIGAGLSGCEAALQLSKRGLKVRLYECKPKTLSPAHSSTNFCELVCSNSLKSNDVTTAGGLIKQELRLLDSEVIAAADTCRVPAGGALAVDREIFSKIITDKINSDKNIEVISEVKGDFDENEYTIIATGPLTINPLSENINKKLGGFLHFYDAAAPIISGDSIDGENSFTASRYEKGGDDYINCPLNRDEYYNFVAELINAECAELKNFEKREIFEGCMPVEVMAKRGIDTLRFGPLKPVGIIDPKTDKRPFAVVQLRKENGLGTMYNIVGFQTNLKFGEQKRVFSMIPALKNAEFLRYGVMHRNSYINAPEVINRYFQVKAHNKVFVAGQLSGVEGYVESIAAGLISAINISKLVNNQNMLELPDVTILGALTRYLETKNTNFQPMNANFGILPPLEVQTRDKALKKKMYSDRAIEAMTLLKININ